MVGFWNLVGTGIAPVSKKTAVKIFFHPAKFDNFKDEKKSDFITVSASQRKNLLD